LVYFKTSLRQGTFLTEVFLSGFLKVPKYPDSRLYMTIAAAANQHNAFDARSVLEVPWYFFYPKAE